MLQDSFKEDLIEMVVELSDQLNDNEKQILELENILLKHTKENETLSECIFRIAWERSEALENLERIKKNISSSVQRMLQ